MVLLDQIVDILKLPKASSSLSFQELCQDTKRLGPDDLFVVLPGETFSSSSLIQQALACGAKAILTDDPFLPDSSPVPLITVPCVWEALEKIHPLFYPQLPRHRVGVTGTNGKSSVVGLLHQLWTLAGIPNASIGTLGLSTSPQLISSFVLEERTTLSGLLLSQIFRACAKQNIQNVAFEVSSHALAQNRIRPLTVEMGIFTSFSQDHLDFHQTLHHYWEAKCRLFTQYTQRYALLFNRLPYQHLLEPLCNGLEVLYFGAEAGKVSDGRNATYHILRQQDLGQLVRFSIEGYQWESFIPLLGGFQMGNLLVALCAFHLLGGSLPTLVPYLSQVVSIRGRMEYVGSCSGAPVYVDYAHTPEALEQALLALKPYVRGKLGLVFGCGGQRDKAKREAMGLIAQRYGDWVIVTDDNPRKEDPAQIRKAILSACTKGVEIVPREKAIFQALKALGPGDIALIAGKGHECVQILGDEVRPFSDHEWIREYLGQKKGEDGSSFLHA